MVQNGRNGNWKAEMLSTPPDERGFDESDRLRQLEHWCEVIAWLRHRYTDDYLTGDLRTRLAVYQAVCLLADNAKQTAPNILGELPAVDWTELVRTRVVLAHIPWRADSDEVWRIVTESVPALQAELRRVIAEEPE